MKIIIAVFLLIILTAGLTFYVVETNCSTTMQVFRQAELARAAEHSATAYFTQPLPTARWELENFSQLLRTIDGSLLEEPDTVEFYKFVTTARLAKLCRDSGDSKHYEEYLPNALEAGKQLKISLKDSAALFEALDRIDQRARQKMGSEGGVHKGVAPYH